MSTPPPAPDCARRNTITKKMKKRKCEDGDEEVHRSGVVSPWPGAVLVSPQTVRCCTYDGRFFYDFIILYDDLLYGVVDDYACVGLHPRLVFVTY